MELLCAGAGVGRCCACAARPAISASDKNIFLMIMILFFNENTFRCLVHTVAMEVMRRLRLWLSCRCTAGFRRFHFLNDALAFSSKGFPCFFIFFQTEVTSAVDLGLFCTCVNAQRLVVPNHEVGVFPHFQRSHAIVEVKKFCRIQRYHFQRFFCGNASVFHNLSSLLI